MVLTINGGSSSIKFALYNTVGLLEKILSGQITRIGLPGTQLTFKKGLLTEQHNFPIQVNDYQAAITWFTTWLETQIDITGVSAIGHRIVQGMQHTQPERITEKLIGDLKAITPYDPEHLPNELKLVESFQKKYPDAPQFACFDTYFHHAMPRVAKLLPVPRRFSHHGIHRYGFHGLSYQFLMQELENLVGEKAAKGRVILAHLGNGASITAVYQGKSQDTSMGFTPAGGLPMSSRAGDLDPGVAWVMMKQENLSPKQFNEIINHESGLLGVSGTTGDMADLLKQKDTDSHAADAVDLFCYQVKKWIGAYAAVLGGIDFLVFAGGIGENAPVVRAKICDSLGFLGIELDEARNNQNSPFISANESRVTVRIIPTDEELIIAKAVHNMISHKTGKGNKQLTIK
jgi:acetate kinase